jgi:hypothetical protein
MSFSVFEASLIAASNNAARCQGTALIEKKKTLLNL